MADPNNAGLGFLDILKGGFGVPESMKVGKKVEDFFNKRIDPEGSGLGFMPAELPFDFEDIANLIPEGFEAKKKSRSDDIQQQIQGLLPQAIKPSNTIPLFGKPGSDAPDVIKGQTIEGIGSSIKNVGEVGEDAPSVITGGMREGIKDQVSGDIEQVSGDVEGIESPEDRAFTQGLDAYINAARGTNAPAPDVKSLDEYKKIFAEATGVDVSGKVDKSAALMAFGLALMQNRAGKGFNLGRILGEVGKAGEIALPKLEAAKKEAKANAIAGGKYALEAKSSDEAVARAAKEKGMIKQRYYIVPKGEGGDSSPSSFLANLDDGSLQELNPYELNALYEQEGFDDKYNIFPASMYDTIIKETMSQKEVKDLYQTGSKDIPLYTGAKGVDLIVQLPDRNKSDTATPKLISDPNQALQQISRMEKGLEKGERLFFKLGELLNQTDTDLPSQLRKNIVQGLRTLGFDTAGRTDPIKQIQYMLTKLKAQNAAEILGESGKTLSDNDRRMVSDIVGEITYTEGDEEFLIMKLNELYNDIIGTRRNEIEEAYANLGSFVKLERGTKPSAGLTFIKGDDGVYRRQTSSDEA